MFSSNKQQETANPRLLTRHATVQPKLVGHRSAGVDPAYSPTPNPSPAREGGEPSREAKYDPADSPSLACGGGVGVGETGPMPMKKPTAIPPPYPPLAKGGRYGSVGLAVSCFLFLVSCFWLPAGAWAQPAVTPPTTFGQGLTPPPPSYLKLPPGILPPDSTNRKELTLSALYELVLNHHPIARQAELLGPAAQAEIQMARGMFDPTISANYDGKTNKGKDYYNGLSTLLKIPTWFGVDVKVGFDRALGDFNNPQDQTPLGGLLYAGVSVPIGPQLVMDERRATLRQAQLLSVMAGAERTKLFNKLLLEATKDYWAWYTAHNTYQYYLEGYNLAALRYVGIVQRIRQGDLAAIDSVEARLEVLKRESELADAVVALSNARIVLSGYLWSPTGEPLELQPNAVPSPEGTELKPVSDLLMGSLRNQTTEYHPEILKLQAKIDQLEVERKLRFTELFPKFNLEYKPLVEPSKLTSTTYDANYFSNNYKLGASFYLPLFLRKGRGKLESIKLKLQDNTLQLDQTRNQLLLALEASRNELINLEAQLAIQREAASLAIVMRNGEQTRFQNGESTLFMLITRERAMISAQIKAVELEAKYAKAKAYLMYSAGQLYVPVAPVGN